MSYPFKKILSVRYSSTIPSRSRWSWPRVWPKTWTPRSTCCTSCRSWPLTHPTSPYPRTRKPRTSARLRLQALAAERLAGLKSEAITRIARPGEAAGAVLQVATELDTDLIVLKTHGRSGLAHFIMGSVAEQIVRRAHCAVLTLTSTAKERHGGLGARLGNGHELRGRL